MKYSAIATMCVVLACAASASGQAIIAPGAGPINRSMAGASTALPVDFGSSYWNPATLSGLPQSEFLLGSELVFPSTHFTSELPAGSVGGFFPPQNRFGTSRSDSGVGSNLATGFAFRLDDDSPITYGLGIFGLIGGNVNFAGNPSIPILAPLNPPRSFGVGPIYANASMLAISPMVSAQLSDRLSVGGGPVITSMSLAMNPAFFAGSRGAFGFPTFPPGVDSRPFWGGGFQLGTLYQVNDVWNVGFSYKSPVWQERWSFNSVTRDLSPRRVGIQASVPAIYSWGVAFKGLPRTLIDVDLRYFDFANSGLFGQRVIDGGLGWQSIFAVATGVSYDLTDRLTLRGGYLFNQSPIPAPLTLFNVQLPGIIEHHLSLGSSLRLTENIVFTAGWTHGFRNSMQGPIGEIPGASVKVDSQVDSILAGFNVQFGRKRPSAAASAPLASSDR